MMPLRRAGVVKGTSGGGRMTDAFISSSPLSDECINKCEREGGGTPNSRGRKKKEMGGTGSARFKQVKTCYGRVEKGGNKKKRGSQVSQDLPVPEINRKDLTGLRHGGKEGEPGRRS